MQNNFAGPTSVPEAVAELAAVPDALVVAGGTDVMLALAAGRVRAPALLTLAWLVELAGWERRADGSVRVGAGLTAANAQSLADLLPALAQAAAAMGTPQVRNSATVGGNLVSAAGGDLLPVLSACAAVVELASAAGVRTLGVDEFLAPAGTARRPGELLTAVTVPQPGQGQEFCRIAVRGAAAPALLSMVAGAGRRGGGAAHVRPGTPGARAGPGGRGRPRGERAGGASPGRARGRGVRPPGRRGGRHRRLPPPRGRGLRPAPAGARVHARGFR